VQGIPLGLIQQTVGRDAAGDADQLVDLARTDASALTRLRKALSMLAPVNEPGGSIAGDAMWLAGRGH
jgi:hypothetical protein